MNNLSEIFIYPIKSTRALKLSTAEVELAGLAKDRRFMLVDPNGKFITARETPKLLSITAQPWQHGLEVSSDSDALTLDIRTFSDRYQDVYIWDDLVQGQHCSELADQWFSNLLDRPCRLLYFGESTSRTTELKPEQPVSFADGYPLLLISDASLLELNRRCSQPLEMAQFRPNLVVKSILPFAEDRWKKIRIGDVEFEVVKPCIRCVMTTYQPDTLVPLANNEPIATLRSFRQDEAGGIIFGQNIVPLNEGTIKQGDIVKVLETQPAKTFIKPKVSATPPQTFTLEFVKSGVSIEVNNAHTILEQAEYADVVLPFNCRAGKCGCCRVQLLEGTVEELSRRPLKQREVDKGVILACSAIPQSDLKIDA